MRIYFAALVWILVLACQRSEKLDIRCKDDCSTTLSGAANAVGDSSSLVLPDAPNAPWKMSVEAGALEPKSGLRKIAVKWSPYPKAKTYQISIGADSTCKDAHTSEVIGIFYDRDYSKEFLAEQGIEIFICINAVLSDGTNVKPINSPYSVSGQPGPGSFAWDKSLPSFADKMPLLTWSPSAEAIYYEVTAFTANGKVLGQSFRFEGTSGMIPGLADGRYQFKLEAVDKDGKRTIANFNGRPGGYELLLDTTPIGTWVTIPSVPLTSRTNSTGVWSGKYAMFWGGSDNKGVSTEGAVYDFVASQWKKMSTSGQPEPRVTSSVWTGKYMFVWGGRDYNAVTKEAGKAFASGGLYDPSDDSWKTVSDKGPSERIGHTMIMAGTKVIVWGGLDHPTFDSASRALGDGGIYDPDTDQWQPIALASQLSRSLHCAVWTGSKMIIWGGVKKSDDEDMKVTAAGTSYDPLTGAWTPISAVDQPIPRYGHSCHWTGSKMIVWGGSIIYYPLASGGIYDPEKDTWSKIDESFAPFAVLGETSLWTGKTMLVWGGGDTKGAYFNHGALYNPETNTWDHLTRHDAPTPRWGQASIWVGDSALIFGGDTMSKGVKGGEIFGDMFRVYVP